MTFILCFAVFIVISRILLMEEAHLPRKSHLLMNPINVRGQRNPTKKSKKNGHTKSKRKAKRKPQTELQIPPVNAQEKLRFPVLGKGNNHINERKNQGKRLLRNLLLSQSQKVILLTQMIQHPVVLRKVSKKMPRKPKGKRIRKIRSPQQRGRVKYQRGPASARTGRWPRMRRLMRAPRRIKWREASPSRFPR